MANGGIGDVKGFSDTARVLARNPLGIIALFIVLVYGFACLVTAFAGSFTPAQKTPLIYFLVVFPVLVLCVFSWLVSKHSGKLFAPSDFRDEDNYVKMQLSAVASLAAASAKGETETPGGGTTVAPTSGSAGSVKIDKIVDMVARVRLPESSPVTEWRSHILWVDDRPDNNIYERQAFEAVGLKFALALSTNEALLKISKEKYGAIISDMGRKEGPREGYALLDAIRYKGDDTPFFIYAGSNSQAHKRETAEHGGQGCTNNPQELFQMVTRSVFSQR
jgi:CheY-like chemotaxis protein